MADLIKDLAKTLSISEDRGKQIVQTFSRVAKDQLLKGQEVILPEVGALLVEKRKGEIVTNPETGLRQVLPERRVLVFNAIDGLQKAVEQMRMLNILLVVPKNNFFARTVRFHFAQKGYTVHILINVDDAVDFIELQSADIVLLDGRMPGIEEISERVKCYRDTSLIPVIEILAKGMTPEKAHPFLVHTDAQLAEPFELDKLLSLVESELQRVGEEEVLFEQEFRVSFETNESNIERVNSIGNVVFKDSGLDDAGQTALSAAFREAVGNAAQHGNNFDENKRVEVLYLLDREKITIAITDEGPGFDHHKYVEAGTTGSAVGKARERHSEGRVGGLGIMLMLKCVDRLEYNHKGNMLTLTKYVKPAEKR